MTTISAAVQSYLSTVAEARSPRTERTYRTGMNAFCAALNSIPLDPKRKASTLDPHTADIAALQVDHIKVFIQSLKRYSAATERLYLTAAAGFYEYLAAEGLATLNLPRLRELIARRARTQGRRRPKFPRDDIENLINYAINLANRPTESASEARTAAGKAAERRRWRLRALRDRAFILLLADTGLRVSEACSLLLGDIDFLEGRLDVLGKGDDEAQVRVSQRALQAIREYLEARQVRDPRLGGRVAGEKEKSLPVFVRHDRGSPGVPLSPVPCLPIAASTAWDFVRQRAVEAVGAAAAAQVHPHSFRHYFVTVVLLATNNLEKARALARHKNIATTQLYAEVDPELDQDYHEIFNAPARDTG